MSEANEHPLLSATDQARLLKTCGAIGATGLATVVLAAVLLNRGLPIIAIGLFVTGAIAILGGPFVALRQIACPRCKMPWLQHALGEKDVGGWLHWLLGFTRCPGCDLSSEIRVENENKM